jgi:hypothetical protein
VKTIVCILAVEMIAATAFTQGQVLFANRVANGWSTHIYGANPSSPGQSQQGNGSADIPSGTTDWSGFPLLDGSQGTFTAQLWAAPGANQPENSLVPVPTTTTVLSGRSAGFLYPTNVVVPNVPGGPGGPAATFMVRVWDNMGGTITSYAQANYRGESPIFSIAGPLPAAFVGLQSFNLAYVPEPSSWAFVALGAALLVVRHSFSTPDRGLQRPVPLATAQTPRRAEAAGTQARGRGQAKEEWTRSPKQHPPSSRPLIDS